MSLALPETYRVKRNLSFKLFPYNGKRDHKMASICVQARHYANYFEGSAYLILTKTLQRTHSWTVLDPIVLDGWPGAALPGNNLGPIEE